MRGPDESPYVPTVVDEDTAESADATEFVMHSGDSASVRRRKELNRVAAQKCRKRKKEKTLTIEKLVHDLESHNTELRWKVADLTNKKQRLFELIQTHCGSVGEALLAALLD